MMIESARPSPSTACSSQGRHAALAVAVLGAAFASNASADAYLSSIGGNGGGQFQAHCAGETMLVGFALRTGDDVDAVRPLCVTAYGPRRIDAIPFTVGDGRIAKYADATREVYGQHQELFGDWWELESGWNGGTGGGVKHIVCPTDQPIVTGMFVGAEGVDTVIVNNIHLFCGVAADSQVASEYPAAIFDAPAYKASKAVFGIGSGGSQPYRDGNTQHCPGGQVAVGVHGRSGKWLDAIGLICGPPHLSEAVKSIGRVNTGNPSKPRPAGWTICDSARDARARNSPAAPNLEAQCLALKTPAKAIAKQSTTLASRSAAYGIATAGPAAAPPPPPPVVVVPNLPPPVVFAPPMLEDNAQLWACLDAAARDAVAGECPGIEAAQAYCRLRGAQSGPDVLTAGAQPGIPVRAVNGELCQDGDACRIVSRLQCDH